MSVHLPIIPGHLFKKPDWPGTPEQFALLTEDQKHDWWTGPREEFSPSQDTLASECEVKWGFRYLWGWNERKDADDYAALARNLGKDIHKQLENYVKFGKAVDTTTLAGQRAFPAIRYLPTPGAVSQVLCEERGHLDTRRINAGVQPIHLNFFIDLQYLQDARWYVKDYKSTKDFRYMKTEAQLRDDAQGIVYPLSIMHRTGQESIDAEWLYIATPHQDTDKSLPPSCKTLRATFHREDVEKRAEIMLVRLVGLRNNVRERAHPLELKPNTEWCRKYYSPKTRKGGCPFRSEIGGPCTHDRPNFGAMLSGLAMLTEPTGDTMDPTVPETALQKKIREANEARGIVAPNAVAPATVAAVAGQGPIVFATPPAGAPAIPAAAAPVTQAPIFPQSPLNPPEGYVQQPAPPPPYTPPTMASMPAVQAPPADARPPLPPPWVYGPNGVPTLESELPKPPPVVQRPPLPEGWSYDANGGVVPPQAAPAPFVAPTQGTYANQQVFTTAGDPPAVVGVAPPAEPPKKGKGRPKGSKNAPATGTPMGTITPDASEGAALVIIRVVEADGRAFEVPIDEEGLAAELATLARNAFTKA